MKNTISGTAATAAAIACINRSILRLAELGSPLLWGYTLLPTTESVGRSDRWARRDHWLRRVEGIFVGGPKHRLGAVEAQPWDYTSGLLHLTVRWLPRERLVRIAGWRRVVLQPGTTYVGGEDASAFSFRIGEAAPIGSRTPGALPANHRITIAATARVLERMVRVAAGEQSLVDDRLRLPELYAGYARETQVRESSDPHVIGSRLVAAMWGRVPACCSSPYEGKVLQIVTGDAPSVVLGQEGETEDAEVVIPLPTLCQPLASLQVGDLVGVGSLIAQVPAPEDLNGTYHQLCKRLSTDLVDNLIQHEAHARAMALRLGGEQAPTYGLPFFLADLTEDEPVGYYELLDSVGADSIYADPQVFRSSTPMSQGEYNFVSHWDSRRRGQGRRQEARQQGRQDDHPILEIAVDGVPAA